MSSHDELTGEIRQRELNCSLLKNVLDHENMLMKTFPHFIDYCKQSLEQWFYEGRQYFKHYEKSLSTSCVSHLGVGELARVSGLNLTSRMLVSLDEEANLFPLRRVRDECFELSTNQIVKGSVFPTCLIAECEAVSDSLTDLLDLLKETTANTGMC